MIFLYTHGHEYNYSTLEKELHKRFGRVNNISTIACINKFKQYPSIYWQAQKCSSSYYEINKYPAGKTKKKVSEEKYDGRKFKKEKGKRPKFSSVN